MKESAIQQLVRLTASQAGAVLFRNNRGIAWMGETHRYDDGTVVIKNARRVEFGLTKGASDLIGWQPTLITPDMVGQTVAIFTALEVKAAKGKPTPDQTNFIDQVNKAGGRAGVVRSSTDAQLFLEI
jgi:hypothetical protein